MNGEVSYCFEKTPLALENEYYRVVNTLRLKYEGWNFNSGNYLFTTDTK
jgi:hypothetical protein